MAVDLITTTRKYKYERLADSPQKTRKELWGSPPGNYRLGLSKLFKGIHIPAWLLHMSHLQCSVNWLGWWRDQCQALSPARKPDLLHAVRWGAHRRSVGTEHQKMKVSGRNLGQQCQWTKQAAPWGSGWVTSGKRDFSLMCLWRLNRKFSYSTDFEISFSHHTLTMLVTLSYWKDIVVS